MTNIQLGCFVKLGSCWQPWPDRAPVQISQMTLDCEFHSSLVFRMEQVSLWTIPCNDSSLTIAKSFPKHGPSQKCTCPSPELCNAVDDAMGLSIQPHIDCHAEETSNAKKSEIGKDCGAHNETSCTICLDQSIPKRGHLKYRKDC